MKLSDFLIEEIKVSRLRIICAMCVGLGFGALVYMQFPLNIFIGIPIILINAISFYATDKDEE